MNKATPRMIIGAAVVTCWLPLAFALLPVPAEEKFLWMWIFTLLLFLLGLGAATLVFRSSQFWPVSVMATSVLYLVVYVIDLSSLPAASFVEAIKLDWRLTAMLRDHNSLDVYLFALLRNFVLPEMHAILVGAVAFLWIRHRRDSGSWQG